MDEEMQQMFDNLNKYIQELNDVIDRRRKAFRILFTKLHTLCEEKKYGELQSTLAELALFYSGMPQ